MTAKKLRVLLIEASAADARNALARLKQGGYAVAHQQVADAAALQKALDKGDWDVVLCSHAPTGFCGLEALELVRKSSADLPFLFLSQDRSEESICRAIQAGANGYIFKDTLDYLGPAIEHSLREAQVRREHNEAQLALQ